MNFKDHLTAGIITGASCGAGAYYLEATPKLAVACAFMGTMGGLFPDLDTGSIPTRWFARFASFIGALGIWQYFNGNLQIMAFMPALILSLAQSGRHRGWTHSYLLPFVVVGLGYLLFPTGVFLFASFGLGILSHYALDSMNPLRRTSWM